MTVSYSARKQLNFPLGSSPPRCPARYYADGVGPHKGGTHRQVTAGRAHKARQTGTAGRWALQAQKEWQVIQVDEIGRAGWQGKFKARQANSDPELHGHPLSHTPVYGHWPDSNTKLIHTLSLYIFQIKDTQHDTLSFPLQTTHKLTWHTPWPQSSVDDMPHWGELPASCDDQHSHEDYCLVSNTV